jgi:hypothetical protein
MGEEHAWTRAWRWAMSGTGRHRAPDDDKPKPIPTEPQIKPDANDPRYDDPSTFGKGWRR